MDKQFNLVNDPWIKAMTTDGEEKELSLKDVFKEADKIFSLAGESQSQDLAVFRFIEAVVQSALPNKNKIDIKHEFISGDALEKINSYLDKWTDKFNLFGDNALYQLSTEDFNRLTDNEINDRTIAKRIGVVEVKMLNRTINESNHTPSLFSPKADKYKNDIEIPELVRWLISYQAFAGTSEKSKVIAKDKFSASAGWLYKTDPVLIQGQTLLDTIALNYLKIDEVQTPVWELDLKDYIQRAVNDDLPMNASSMYTMLSRVFHIIWNDGEPEIFTASLPKIDQFYLDPMTIKTANVDGEIYAKTYSQKNFNQLKVLEFSQWSRLPIMFSDKKFAPETTYRLISEYETNRELLEQAGMINLISSNYVSDGNTMSQTPAFEFIAEQKISGKLIGIQDFKDVLSDLSKIWEVITIYYSFLKDIARIFGMTKPAEQINYAYSTIEPLSLQLRGLIDKWLHDDQRNSQMLFKQVDNLIYEHVQDYMYKYGIVKLTKESASDKTDSIDAMEALKKFLGVKTALLLGDNKEDNQKQIIDNKVIKA